MKRPLNVLRVITWLPVGGIERKILAVLPRLDPERFRVRVVCLRERGELASALEAAGIRVDLSPMPTRLSPVGLRRLTRYMRREQIDLVHAHMYRSNVPATIAARAARVPAVICQIHNVDSWDTPRQRWMDRLLCRWRHAIVAVSERVRRDVIASLNVPAERTRVIYNGVETERFADGSLREPTRQALGLRPSDLAIVYHHRLVDQKNPGILLKIASRIAARRRGVRVLVAGDGPRREGLERAAAEQGLADRLRFLGKRDDVPALLQASDLAILPSFKEGFSNALLEALAAGLPVVATDVGGNAEAIEHGKSGWIVPPHNDAAFLSAVAELVDSPAERKRMAREASRRAERFSLERMVAEVEALYEELYSEAKRRDK